MVPISVVVIVVIVVIIQIYYSTARRSNESTPLVGLQSDSILLGGHSQLPDPPVKPSRAWLSPLMQAPRNSCRSQTYPGLCSFRVGLEFLSQSGKISPLEKSWVGKSPTFSTPNLEVAIRVMPAHRLFWSGRNGDCKVRRVDQNFYSDAAAIVKYTIDIIRTCTRYVICIVRCKLLIHLVCISMYM